MGGRLQFETGAAPELNRGDVVFFRGEEIMHWVSPITGGKRIVLQVEWSDETEENFWKINAENHYD